MPEDTTRRRFVAAAGTISAAVLAGCTDAPFGDGSQDDGMDQTTDGMTETNGGMTGMDDGTTEMDDGMNETDDEMSETTEGGMMATRFTVRVENVSSSSTLQTMDGGKPVPLSPLAYAVHEDPAPLFAPGETASTALERLAEDGDPMELVQKLEMDGLMGGAVAVPMESDQPAPIAPGESYEFTVEASAGQRLSLATMFVQSNDLFYAPGETGIPLFEDDEPVSGDVTEQFALWDAGTEQNEEPGTGSHQAPRQMEMNSGPSEDGSVRSIMEVDDGYSYPETSAVLNVTISQESMNG